MNASIVTLFLLLSSCALVQSQPRQPERRAGGTEQPAAQNPRGTDASPLVVKVQPPDKTDPKTAEEQRQKDQEATDRQLTRRLAVATSILAFLQLVAIGFQAGIAATQNRIINKQNEIMRGQREAADRQSDYMRDGLAETKRSADAAAKSADANIRQSEIAWTHMYESLRARMGLQPIVTFNLGPGHPMPTIEFQFKNHGVKTAYVIQHNITPLENGPLPATPKWGTNWRDIGKPVESGNLYTASLRLSPIAPSDWARWDNINGTDRFYVFGQLRYDDGFGNIKTHAFGRVYSPETSRSRGHIVFSQVGGKAYNWID